MTEIGFELCKDGRFENMIDNMKLKNKIDDNMRNGDGIEMNDGIYDMVKRKSKNISYRDAMDCYKAEIKSVNGANVHKNRICGLLGKYFR